MLSAVTWRLQLSLTHRFKWSMLSVSASAPWTTFSSFLPFRDCNIPSSAWSETGQGCKMRRETVHPAYA